MKHTIESLVAENNRLQEEVANLRAAYVTLCDATRNYWEVTDYDDSLTNKENFLEIKQTLLDLLGMR